MIRGYKKLASFGVASNWSSIRSGFHAVTGKKGVADRLAPDTPGGDRGIIGHGHGLCQADPLFSMEAKLSTCSKAYRRRNDMGTEHIIDRHFASPLNKHLDSEDNAEKSLEEIAREQKQNIKLMKKARAAREFTKGSEAEKRTLSWDTIDQIHYLRQESPDEWSVAMLAESFNVSEDVIAKVLRSKFRPDRRIRGKQDQMAAENTGYVTRKTNTKAIVSAGSDTKTKQSKYNGPGNLRDSSDKSKWEREWKDMPDSKQASTVLSSSKEKSSNLGPRSRHQQEIAEKNSRPNQSVNINSRMQEDGESVEKDPEMEFSFGQFDFENVDSLMGQAKLKPQIFQKGRNFYNENGEFLYRI